MKNRIVAVIVTLLVTACGSKETKSPNTGIWRAELAVMDDQVLPFNFKFEKSDTGDYTMEIYNAEEVILVDEITIEGDSIKIRTPVFEGYMAGTFTGETMNGQFIKESLDRIVPFSAYYNEVERFDKTAAPNTDISGVWETDFSIGTEDHYKGKGIFSQKGNLVTGTFRTTTGDYRYLEGIADGDSLKLSAFDGAHAFLFAAKMTDSSLQGTFYSGNHFKEPFLAKRNKDFELVSADSLTFIKEGYERFTFKFPNSEGTQISLDDASYKNKVVLVQIMGTWCPNCLDETKFYLDYMKHHTTEDLEVVALAFEYAKTKEGAFKSIQRMRDRIGVDYPILLAQYGTSDKEKAQEKLPMLNHVLSYPTTIFIDKKGAVRKIHTGFNGPATGEKHTAFKKEFDTFVQLLLAE